MERLAKKIAASVGESLGKNEEEIAVMAYGLIGILQFLAIFILASIIGIVLGFWLEVVVVFLSGGFDCEIIEDRHSKKRRIASVYSKSDLEKLFKL